MKAENAIEVRNITKKFRVYLDRGHTLKELTLFKKRRKFEERVVLDDISFEVKKGEAVGLIGHNGCGKSTTLKLLTRIMYPDSGSIEMRGRVSSLIELGAGFHPDMSGRQNIYTNAAIFGLSRKEIQRREASIIAFSEMGDFIDNPVRTYSSGMYMRLAFAVAINVDAEILLIDEILAVGDANFQAKCFNRLKQIKTEGTTIVIVSHSLGQIEEICERSFWINKGKIAAEGAPRDVHPMYLEHMGQKRQDIKEAEAGKSVEQEADAGKERLSLDYAQMVDGEGKEQLVIKTGMSAAIKIGYDAKEAFADVIVGIEIVNGMNVKCYGTSTRIDYIEDIKMSGKGEIVLELKDIPLLPGQYSVDIKFNSDSKTQVSYYKKALQFEMYSDIADGGIARIEHQWEIG